MFCLKKKINLFRVFLFSILIGSMMLIPALRILGPLESALDMLWSNLSKHTPQAMSKTVTPWDQYQVLCSRRAIQKQNSKQYFSNKTLYKILLQRHTCGTLDSKFGSILPKEIRRSNFLTSHSNNIGVTVHYRLI